MKTELVATMLDKIGLLTRTTVSSMFRINSELNGFKFIDFTHQDYKTYLNSKNLCRYFYHIYMKDLKVEN